MITVVATTIIAISIALSVECLQEKHRVLVYAVNQVRTTIVVAGEASGLVVTYEGEELGDVDVTVAQIAIWNAGELPIWWEDVLEPIVVVTDPPVRILAANLRQQTRSLTQFFVDASPESLENGNVQLSWRVLETNDGGSIQLVYVGPAEVGISVQGTVLGQGRPQEIKTPEERTSGWISWFLLSLAVLYLIAFGYMLFSFRKQLHPKRDWGNVVLVAVTLAVAGIMFWLFALNLIVASAWPPFGF